ncbi:uncharacterized protein TM35_000161640 [Trypanosoma theileri]|uniref:Uncharacterized protein n=1 Tax=Trypanosoma theileri TaxID=67003 RepID=A0A1X0NUZ9_9TRYP|nr:uncharacterized protein TM35_000161640 [Trypanosoma theileri]ORC88526.1 hypothetical protein TM35_000161640 [Trypanosoma theileri]
MPRNPLLGITVPSYSDKESREKNDDENENITELHSVAHIVSFKPHEEKPLYSSSSSDVDAVGNTNNHPTLCVNREMEAKTVQSPMEIENGKPTREETVRIAHFTSEEMLDLKKKFRLFLQDNFEKAYTLALQQARERQSSVIDGKVLERLLLYRQAQEQRHKVEMEQQQKRLSAQYDDEHRSQRRAVYQQQVKVLQAKERERRVEYQQLLEEYYTHCERERQLNDFVTLPVSNNNLSPLLLSSGEEMALKTSPECMTRKQIQHLRHVLYRLQMEVKSVRDEVQRSLSWREINVSNVAAQVQQQYQAIILEQQQEMNMLQKWHDKMKQLEKEVEESITIFKEERYELQKRLESREKQHILPSLSDYKQGGMETNGKERVLYRKGLFDLIL